MDINIIAEIDKQLDLLKAKFEYFKTLNQFQK